MTAATKQSTWRSKELFLKAGIVNEMLFEDTTPNHIHINNLGAGNLYLSVTGVPSTEVYDKYIPAYGTGLFAQDLGTTRIQIYVDGADSNRVKVTTFETEFNPATLIENTFVGSTGGGGVAESVSINGFTVPLPSGANNIGKVVVTEMPQQTFVLDTLPAGTNNIGKVDIAKLPALAEGNSHIGEVDVRNALTIASMPPVVVSDQPIRQKHHVFDQSVGNTLVTFDMTQGGITPNEDVNYISYIENEGDTELFVSFDTDIPTAASGSGLNKQIRLRAGEVISDIPRKCNKVHFIRSTGAGNARFMGV